MKLCLLLVASLAIFHSTNAWSWNLLEDAEELVSSVVSAFTGTSTKQTSTLKNGTAVISESNGTVILNVNGGNIMGRIKSTKSNKTFYSFQGVPYAAPPVGDHRFKFVMTMLIDKGKVGSMFVTHLVISSGIKLPPQAVESWDGVRSALEIGSSCLQPYFSEVSGSEDCLFLNVYTPQVLTNTSSNASLAVMVFIHGGEFYTGSGCTDLYGPEYLVEEDVVLVTLNYRLGVLGFLGVANSNVSINAGLKDQLAALKWVNENIGNFSGDRSKITLFGQNAGGSSVEYHILSPASKGLFQRAISQSGNAVDPWAFVDSDVAKERALRLGQALGTNTTNVDELVQLLQNTSGDELVTKQLQAQSLQESYKRLYPFVPTLESSAQEGDIVFVIGKPMVVLLSGKINAIPFITGVNNGEGKLYVMDVIANETLWDEYEETMERFVPNDLGYAWGSSQSVAVAKKIKKFYFNDTTLTNSSLSSLVDVAPRGTFIIDNWPEQLFVQRQSSPRGRGHYACSEVGLSTDLDNWAPPSGPHQLGLANWVPKLVGDILFSYPHHTSVLLHVLKGKAPVYVYGFAYDGRLGLTSDIYNFTFTDEPRQAEREMWRVSLVLPYLAVSVRVWRRRNISIVWTGPAHTDELGYLFNGTRFPKEVEPNSTEAFIRQKMVAMWTKFSKDGESGKPFGETLSIINRDSNLDLPIIGSLVHCESSALDHVATQTYLDITSNPSVGLTSEDSEVDRMNFWTAIYLPVWLTSFPNLAALFLSIV
uniref:Carboxylesterase type B domain-containing protein n=1 Tax=Timema monikensis TaxID=170555 RepID=A0A7R9E7D3_9NEOP|nr:unnamed protein product [Timema monikensis]